MHHCLALFWAYCTKFCIWSPCLFKWLHVPDSWKDTSDGTTGFRNQLGRHSQEVYYCPIIALASVHDNHVTMVSKLVANTSCSIWSVQVGLCSCDYIVPAIGMIYSRDLVSLFVFYECFYKKIYSPVILRLGHNVMGFRPLCGMVYTLWCVRTHPHPPRIPIHLHKARRFDLCSNTDIAPNHGSLSPQKGLFKFLKLIIMFLVSAPKWIELVWCVMVSLGDDYNDWIRRYLYKRWHLSPHD